MRKNRPMDCSCTAISGAVLISGRLYWIGVFGRSGGYLTGYAPSSSSSVLASFEVCGVEAFGEPVVARIVIIELSKLALEAVFSPEVPSERRTVHVIEKCFP